MGSLQDRCLELLEIYGAVVVLVAGFYDLVDALAVDLVHVLVCEEGLQFLSVD